MKLFKRFMPVLVVLTLLGVLLAGCKAAAETTAPELVTIQKGSLKIDITAVGNLAYSLEENLSFKAAGTVDVVSVKAGDSVTKGQILASLDASELEDKITSLESQVTAKIQTQSAKEQSVITAERQVTAKQRQVTTAQRQLETARNNLIMKQLDVAQAQINIKNGELSLAQAEHNFELGKTQWDDDLVAIQKLQLAITKEKLDDAYKAVETARVAITDAETAIEDAQVGVEDAQNNLKQAKSDVETAKQDVADAQMNVDEMKATDLNLIAPFDGVITSVKVAKGDAAKKGAAVIVIVDPTRFSADVLVNETDISQVKLDGQATVSLDALPGISIPASITSISPTATLQQGIVNYQVKVQLTPLQELLQQFQKQGAQSQGATGQTRIAPQLSSGQPRATGQIRSSGLGIAAIQLRHGLTATVSIIIQEANDIVLVPNQAIVRNGLNLTVNVLKDGVTTSRTIKTGISDYQYTEVTEGLNEGETVVIPQAAASAANRTQSAGGMIPGMPRVITR